jgi:hypothetical protein
MPIRKESKRHGRTEETAERSSEPRAPGNVDTKGIGTNLVHMRNEVFFDQDRQEPWVKRTSR